MPRPIGLPKTGGRKKGTPNQSSQALVDFLSKRNVSVVDSIVDLLPQLSPEKQADVLLNLIGYVFPKKKAIDHEINLSESSCKTCSSYDDRSEEEIKESLRQLREINDILDKEEEKGIG